MDDEVQELLQLGFELQRFGTHAESSFPPFRASWMSLTVTGSLSVSRMKAHSVNCRQSTSLSSRSSTSSIHSPPPGSSFACTPSSPGADRHCRRWSGWPKASRLCAQGHSTIRTVRPPAESSRRDYRHGDSEPPFLATS